MATTILSTRAANPTSFSALTINYSTLIGSTIIISSIGSICCVNTSTVIDSTLVARNVSFSTMLGSTITTTAFGINSNQVSIGLSTNQSYPNGAYGAISTTGNWITSLPSLLSTKSVSMSANAQYQLAVTQISTISSLYFTSTTNTGWVSTLSGATGLPSNTQTIYTAGALSATGQYGILGTYGGYPYITSSFGASWYNANATVTPTNLYAYFPFNNTLADVQGRASLTVTGSVSYAAGIVHPNAVYISNPGSPTTATNFIRGTMPNSTNFTVTGWFKLNSYNTATPQIIFSCGNTGYDIFIVNGTNYLSANHQPTNTNLATTTSAIALNTWYSFSYTFRAGGTSSLYLNGSLVGSATSPSSSLAAISAFSLGSHDATTQYPFDGYIDDLRIYTNFIPNTESVPYSYFPFDGSTIDVQGNTTLTTNGSVSYVAGIDGSNALSITNIAGGTATNYLQAPFRLGNSFVVSFDVNFQTLPATDSTTSSLFSLGNGSNNAFEIMYYTGGPYTGFYVQNFTSGGLASILGLYAISANTWYNVRCNFQGDGTSTVHINNIRVATASTPVLARTITTLTIGIAQGFASSAFNGYIDDLRIYDTSSALLPPFYLPCNSVPATNSFDTSGQTKLTVVGSIATTPGIVGVNAINFTNTIGGASATQYIRGTWTTPTTFTFDFWFNTQGSGSQQNIIFTSNSSTGIFISSSNLLFFFAGGVNLPGVAGFPVSTNTWYRVVAIYQGGSTGYLYINNVLIGSGTCPASPGTNSDFFTISGTDAAGGSSPYVGYIDDVRIYNYAIAIPPSAIVPLNYTNVAISASGQYMLATATNAGLYMSSNFGRTWSQISSIALNAIWRGLAISTTGQYILTTSEISMQISPQTTGLDLSATITSTTPVLCSWTQNMITWTSFCSSNNGSAVFQSWVAFNNLAPGSASGYYSYASNGNYSSGTYNNTFSMTIQSPGPGLYFGEWIQLQSSTPLVLNSYNFACGATGNIPKNFFIVGSNDGTTWFPIQLAAGGATNPFSANFTRATSPNIIANQSGAQTMTAGATGTYTCTTYGSHTTRSYTYFRLIANSLYSASNLEFTELYMQFNTGISAQLTGLTGNTSTATPVSTTWAQNGVTWTSNSSSVVGTTFQSWIAFNNVVETNASGNYSWASATVYNTSTGNYTGSVTTTILGGIGAVLGEWIQLQSSIPLVLQSYTYGGGSSGNLPRRFYIIGSTDGTLWYPIQYVEITGNIYTASFQRLFSPNIIVNQTGSQVVTAGASATFVCRTFSTTTNSYTYFRIISLQTYGIHGNFEFVELNLNFTSGQSYSTNYGTTWTNTALLGMTDITIQSISGNGQYAIATNGQTAYLVSNYLAGFSTNTSTSPTLPSINASIVAAALSNTGQYMVLVTEGTTNNVYYSMNYGATFVNLTIGSTAMTACTISADGSFITVTNTTTLYTLNNNGTGFSIAIGWQAGQQSQGQNAIAIGSQAGTINQVGGSIILNASGSALTATQQGLYINPVLPIVSSSASFVSVLGYGLDNQITQSSGAVIILPNGNLGIGTTNPTSAVQIIGQIASPGKTFDMNHPLYPNTNRRLVHSSIEGPRCDLIYRGTIVLQAGAAQLDINKQCTASPQGAMDDGTFEVLCTNPQYFLQNLTGFDRLIGSIQGSTLTITCENSESVDTVSWIVVAERADLYIKEWNRTDQNGLLITQYAAL